jgi:methionyl-tRNA synthetase
MKTQQLHQVLNVIWSVVGEANRYFAGEAPWAAAKTDPERMRTILYVTAEVLRQVAVSVQPVIPQLAPVLLDLLGVAADERDFAAISGGRRIRAGIALPPPKPVFPRYVEPENGAPA